MSSFVNVQLFARGRNAEEIRAAALASLRASLAGEWVEVEPGVPCQRVVLVGPPDEWIAVYDDAADDSRPLAAQLSVAARTPAVAIIVHDGDLLLLTIFRDGEVTGDVINWPGYFRGAPPDAHAVGDITAWRELLVVPEIALREAWLRGTDPDPATAIVQRMGALTGWSPLLATSSARTLTARKGFTQLCLRRPTATAPSGPPRIDIQGGSPGVTVRTGDTVNVVVIGRGSGGALSIAVTFSGPAAALLKPRSVTLTSGGRATELTLDENGRAVAPFGPAERIELIAAFTATSPGTAPLRITLTPAGGDPAIREIPLTIT